MTWADGLTRKQAEVVGTPDLGNARLLAGPGTGKTYTLVRRVEFLLQTLNAEQTVLALAFTRAATAEMRERLERRPDVDMERVKVSTLHAYALGELLNNDDATGRLFQPLRIVGDWEQRHVVEEELARSTGRRVLDVRRALVRLENDWNTLTADREGWQSGYPDSQFLGAWLTHRQVYGYTLRSELVYQFRNELRQDPGLQPRRQPAVMLVDEYQDLNACELDTLNALALRTGSSLFAAGDDDQSIYGFRHAAPEGIRTFHNSYPGALDLRLEDCLRCGPAIVDLAQWLIGQEQGRAPKTLHPSHHADRIDFVPFADQHAEATGLAEIIVDAIDRGTAPEKVLVLYRHDSNGKFSQLLDDALTAAGVLTYSPRGGEDPDLDLVLLQLYLQLALALEQGDVDHLSLRGLLELEDNRVGASTLGNVVDLAVDRSVRFADAIDLHRHALHAMGAAARGRLITSADAIYERARACAPAADDETAQVYLQRVAEVIGVDDDVVARLETAPGGLPDPTAPSKGAPRYRENLLSALNGLDDSRPAVQEGHVTLTTMHGAKGLTADLVVVCQLEDEEIPGAAPFNELNELRRLVYVSITRPRAHLVLSICQRRTGDQSFRRGGGTQAARQRLTRFLEHRGLTASRVEDITQR